MNHHPVIHIISGPTAAGKTTVCSEILSRNPGKIERIITTTSRPRREGETHGLHYYFMEREEFEDHIKTCDFIEYAIVHTNLYGSTETELKRILDSGKSPLYVVDPQGMIHLQAELNRRGYEVVSYFLDAPMEVLEERLSNRGTENEDTFRIRVATALIEKEQAPLYDHQIENIDLEKTIRILSEKMGLAQ